MRPNHRIWLASVPALSAALWMVAIFSVNAATVIWDGGGDATSWNDARNWSGDALPTSADEVVINVFGDLPVVVNNRDVTIRSLRCEKSLIISGGNFTVTSGASVVTGTLTVASSRSLRVSGAGTTLLATNLTSVDGGSFSATGGAALSLSGIGRAGRSSRDDATWQADGAGSRIVLAGLTNLVGYADGGWWHLRAYNGGRLELPALQTLSNGWFDVYAEGVNAVVDLSALSSYQPGRSDQYMQIEARSQGTVLIRQLTDGQHLALTLRSGGTVPTAQFTRVGQISLDGVSATFSKLAALDDTSLYVKNGAVLSLSGIGRAGRSSRDDATWQADGAGSRIVLAGLTNLVGYADGGWWHLRAYNGGRLELPALQTLSNGWFDVYAEGVNAVVDLSALSSYQPGRSDQYMQIEARNGSSILISNFTQLDRVSLTIRDGGIIPTRQIRSLTHATVTIDGATVSFPALKDITGTSFAFQNGGGVAPTSTNTFPLLLNKQEIGQLENVFSEDHWIFSAVAGQQIRFDLVNVSSPVIAFDLRGPNDWIGFKSLTNDSDLVTLTASGGYTLVARGLSGQFEKNYTFRLVETIQTDLPPDTTLTGHFVGNGQAQIFRVTLTNSRPMRIVLSNTGAGNLSELYVRLGTPPTRGDYDYRFGRNPAASQNLLVPTAASGTWYVLVYGETITTPSDFTISAVTSDVFITDATPHSHANDAPITMTITGAGFLSSPKLELVASNGASYPAKFVERDSFTQLTATFAPSNVPAGIYSVRVSNAEGGSAILTNAVTVVFGAYSKLATKVILPSQLGYHAVATIYVEYSNTGTKAMPAPLLLLRATQKDQERAFLTLQQMNLVSGFWTSSRPEGFSSSVQILGSGAIPGTLQPGETMRVPVYYAGWQQPWDFGYPPIQFSLLPFTVDDATPVDWSLLKDAMKPVSLDVESWNALWPGFVAQVGNTWGDYVRMIADNATYLGRLGERVLDVNQLLGFELQQANGLSPLPVLADAVDASVEAPGLPLVFRRSIGASISSRYQLGPFGRGWSHNWLYALEQSLDGKATVVGPGGSRRIFQPDSRRAGAYFSQPGDHGTLSGLAGTGLTLREPSGLLRVFRSDGKLDYIQDLNGNRITAGYTGNFLSQLTHSSGQSLQIVYNGNRIQSVTDHLGRQTHYTYDATNEHLRGTLYYDGRTSAYDYGSGPSQHALTASSSSCCVTRYFTYDNQGRLSGTYREGNAEAVKFTYDNAGKVTATDAFDHSSKFFFDHRGLLVKIEDPLTNTVQRAFDDEFNLVSLTDPAGHSYRYGYDGRGNLMRSTDALGSTTFFGYHPTLNRLVSITDANKSPTQYAYTTNGNLLSITYADTSVESWAYDRFGSATTWTNRRKHSITYTYNANGKLTSKRYADGASARYDYDSRGNLTNAVTLSPQSAVLESNTMRYEANDRLTNITYTGGQWLSFTYDSAGRRASSLDQLGHRLNYFYNTAGRLESMTNELNQAVVHYEYDAAGRLSRKNAGGVIFTTYEYDAAGQLLNMTNALANGTVLSRFNYTYDTRGRRRSMDAAEGRWTYDYDDIGQLTHAVFASRTNAIPNQDLTYKYDLLGNRTNTIENGVSTIYTPNNLNQYVKVGDTRYVFDADGNLLQEITPQGTNTFTFDDENKLIRVTKGIDRWDYIYDAVGNRVKATDNGVTTGYVIDPIGLGDLVGEYDGAKNPIARYDHGIGLVSLSRAGANFRYTFDALGNSAELITDAGAIANAYRFAPFGTLIEKTESTPNLFRFVGSLNVVSDRNGIAHMRARDQIPQIARFLQDDPLGHTGGDANLLTYAKNNPLSYVDPMGLKADPTDTARKVLDLVERASAISDLKDLADLFKREPVTPVNPSLGNPLVGGPAVNPFDAVTGILRWENDLLRYIVKALDDPSGLPQQPLPRPFDGQPLLIPLPGICGLFPQLCKLCQRFPDLCKPIPVVRPHGSQRKSWPKRLRRGGLYHFG